MMEGTGEDGSARGWEGARGGRGSSGAEGKDTRELKAQGHLITNSPEMEDAYLRKLHPSGWWGRMEEGSGQWQCLGPGGRSAGPTPVCNEHHQPNTGTPSSSTQWSNTGTARHQGRGPGVGDLRGRR